MSLQRSIPAPSELTAEWLVRPAAVEDAEAVAISVQRLLHELGATPAPAQALAEAARAILAGVPETGAVYVAQAEERIIGVLAASFQEAIHVPGRYALIQDLWVEPSWRGQLVGAGLMDAFVGGVGELGIGVVEVGLPQARFSGLEATEAFYSANDFVLLGRRMRRVLR